MACPSRLSPDPSASDHDLSVSPSISLSTTTPSPSVYSPSNSTESSEALSPSASAQSQSHDNSVPEQFVESPSGYASASDAHLSPSLDNQNNNATHSWLEPCACRTRSRTYTNTYAPRRANTYGGRTTAPDFVFAPLSPRGRATSGLRGSLSPGVYASNDHGYYHGDGNAAPNPTSLMDGARLKGGSIKISDGGMEHCTCSSCISPAQTPSKAEFDYTLAHKQENQQLSLPSSMRATAILLHPADQDAQTLHAAQNLPLPPSPYVSTHPGTQTQTQTSTTQQEEEGQGQHEDTPSSALIPAQTSAPGSGSLLSPISSNNINILLLLFATLILGIAIGSAGDGSGARNAASYYFWQRQQQQVTQIVHTVGEQLPLLDDVREMANTWARLPDVLFGEGDDDDDVDTHSHGSSYQKEQHCKNSDVNGVSSTPSPEYNGEGDGKYPQHLYSSLESMLLDNVHHILTEVCSVLKYAENYNPSTSDLDFGLEDFDLGSNLDEDHHHHNSKQQPHKYNNNRSINIATLCDLAWTHGYHAPTLWTSLYDDYMNSVRTPFQPAAPTLRRVGVEISRLDNDSAIFTGPDSAERQRRTRQMGNNKTFDMDLPGWYSLLAMPGVGSELQCNVLLGNYCNRGSMGVLEELVMDEDGNTKTHDKTSVLAHPLCAAMQIRDHEDWMRSPIWAHRSNSDTRNNNNKDISDDKWHALSEQSRAIIYIRAAQNTTASTTTFTGEIPRFPSTWHPDVPNLTTETILTATLRHTLALQQAAHIILNTALAFPYTQTNDDNHGNGGSHSQGDRFKWPRRAYGNLYDDRNKIIRGREQKAAQAAAQDAAAAPYKNDDDDIITITAGYFPALRALAATLPQLDALAHRASRASVLLAQQCQQSDAILEQVAALHHGRGWFTWQYQSSSPPCSSSSSSGSWFGFGGGADASESDGGSCSTDDDNGGNPSPNKFVHRGRTLELHHYSLPSQQHQVAQLEHLAAFMETTEGRVKKQLLARRRVAWTLRRGVERKLAKLAGVGVDSDSVNVGADGNYDEDISDSNLNGNGKEFDTTTQQQPEHHHQDGHGFIFWWLMNLKDSEALRLLVEEQEMAHLRDTDPNLAAYLDREDALRSSFEADGWNYDEIDVDESGNVYYPSYDDEGFEDDGLGDWTVGVGSLFGDQGGGGSYTRVFEELLQALNTHNGPGSGSGSSNLSDYYALLGVSRDASTKEIRAAGRRLMKELHPDKIQMGRGKEDGKRDLESINAGYIQVQKARTILEDPEARAAYDEGDRDGLRRSVQRLNEALEERKKKRAVRGWNDGV